ncbi:hypothetical protein [Ruegeria sp. ANG-S4]|uniref:hypothetical protein n=1 Tax=Ruegeria sp. ANG-S4 TaxID=1577904 RepID=UPI002689DCD3
MTLTPTRFENGLWEGHITSDTEPRVRAVYLGDAVSDIELIRDTDGWTLRVPVPASAVSEGVHSIIIQDLETNARLADFTIIAGDPAADDLRGEVALLRAELDMLKRAFRRVNSQRD